MANEVYASSLLIEVAGRPLSPDVAQLLSRGHLENSANLLDVFVLRFRDSDRVVVAKGGFAIGAKVKLSVRTSDPGAPTPLLTGEVTSLSVDLDGGGTFTEVRGYDEAHRLTRGRRTAAYPDMSLGEIVRKVARRAGLREGVIDIPPGVGGRMGFQLNQAGVSDWEFLAELARLTGAQVSVADGALSFRPPRPPGGAPGPGSSAARNPLVLEAGTSLISLAATVTAMGQVPAVEARGWDYESKREVVATGIPRTVEAIGAEVDPVALADVFGAPPYVVGNSRYRTQAEVQARADAVAADIGGTAAELEGTARGNPSLRAGAAVSVANVGAPFDGDYTLTSTRHAFTGTGYTTMFTISSRQDRSLYALTSQPRTTWSTGLVPAIVSDIRDPLDLGRVRLTMPWLSGDFTSGWARVALPGAGRGRGAILPYEVGDEVLAGFEGGDFDHPYVLGGLFNGQDTPPRLSEPLVDGGSGEAGVRALVSRAGHRLELAETGGILLATGDDRLSVRLDRASGKVVISGSAGVTVDAGNGTLELTGARVTVSGRTDVVVQAKQVRIN